MAQTVQTQADPASRDPQVRQVHHPFQAIGLTKAGRRCRPPAVLDLSFDARAGQVTVLLGPEGSGRTTALRLALGLEAGQGAALFHGRPYRRLSRPEREVGVVLGPADRPAGHPGRKARAHLRMMAAAAGVPARRADQLLEQTRLGPAAEHRLRTFSPGMTRRLQLAQALLGDPGTLLLDEPTEGLSPRNTEWFHAFLRAFAAGGGAVLVTLRSPQQAAQLADRVVTLELGRLLADQPVDEFRRTRLRDEVSVRGPQVSRLGDLLAAAGATVRHDGGNVISVEGMARTEIGELAFRHGILLHELADQVVEHAATPGPRPAEPAGATPARVAVHTPAHAPEPEPAGASRVTASDPGATGASPAGSTTVPEPAGATSARAAHVAGSAGATLARATVALGRGEEVTTEVIVPAAPATTALPARRDPKLPTPAVQDDAG